MKALHLFRTLMESAHERHGFTVYFDIHMEAIINARDMIGDGTIDKDDREGFWNAAIATASMALDRLEGAKQDANRRQSLIDDICDLAETLPLVWTICAPTKAQYGYSKIIVDIPMMREQISARLGILQGDWPEDAHTLATMILLDRGDSIKHDRGEV